EIYEKVTYGRDEGSFHGGRAVAAAIVGGAHLRGRGRARDRSGAAARVGVSPATVDRGVSSGGGGGVVVDPERRVLRQRRDAHRSARLPVGRDEAARPK